MRPTPRPRAYSPGGDEDKMREAVRLAVRRCATLWTGKKPVVEVMLLAGRLHEALTSIVAIYFLFFAFSAFLLLPFGVRTDEEAGDAEDRRARRKARRTGSTSSGICSRRRSSPRCCSRFITRTGPTAGSRRTTSTSTTAERSSGACRSPGRARRRACPCRTTSGSPRSSRRRARRGPGEASPRNRGRSG